MVSAPTERTGLWLQRRSALQMRCRYALFFLCLVQQRRV